MEIIRKWLLTGKNFYVGVAIYKTIGTNDKLKAVFANGKTPFAEQNLEKELTSLLRTPKQHPEKKVLPAEIIPESTDNVLQAIRNTWLPKYQRLNYLRHELDKYHGNSPAMIAIRKPIAFEILELEQECMNHWKQADEYQKTGKLPSTETDEEMIVPEEPLERAKAIENTKRNIRRNRQQMAKQPNKPQLVTLYNRYKDFYFRLTGNQYEEKA